MNDYEVGDYFSGILIETFRESGISRPRVRPVNAFHRSIRVEFPRKLREEYPIGTRFRAVVKVCQKTNKGTGQLIGDNYLLAVNGSIELDSSYSPLRQVFAIPAGFGDRLYTYVEESVEQTTDPLAELRNRAYQISSEEVDVAEREMIVRNRDAVIRSYALERSSGVCEACDEPAPFETRNGRPYLEVHHIVPVSEGGPDNPTNVAGVCPNCHARVTHGEDAAAYNGLILNKIKSKEASLGPYR